MTFFLFSIKLLCKTEISFFLKISTILMLTPSGNILLFRTFNESIVSFRKNVDIYPGTIIYVPREIGQLDGINYAAVVAPIFSSLALSLASLNSIKD